MQLVAEDDPGGSATPMDVQTLQTGQSLAVQSLQTGQSLHTGQKESKRATIVDPKGFGQESLPLSGATHNKSNVSIPTESKRTTIMDSAGLGQRSMPMSHRSMGPVSTNKSNASMPNSDSKRATIMESESLSGTQGLGGRSQGMRPSQARSSFAQNNEHRMSRKSIFMDENMDLTAQKLAMRFGEDLHKGRQSKSQIFEGSEENSRWQRNPGALAFLQTLRNFWDEAATRIDETKLALWLVMEEPFGSTTSKVVTSLMLLIICLSIIHAVQYPEPMDLAEVRSPWDAIEMSFNICFVMEMFLRIWSHPCRRRWLKEPANVIDFCAVLPFFVNEVIGLRAVSSGFVQISTFEGFLRLLKLSRYFWGWQLLFKALSDATSAMIIPLFFLLLIVLFGSCLLLAIESEHEGHNIIDLPTAIYFCFNNVVSINVGPFYHLEPVTKAGRLVAAILMMVGVMFMAMPIAIVGTCFSETWFDQDRIILIDKVRTRLEQQGFEIANLREVFDEIDEDGSGEIEFAEFKRLIEAFHLYFNISKVRQLFNFFDVGSTGAITYEEFVCALYPESMVPEDDDDDEDESEEEENEDDEQDEESEVDDEAAEQDVENQGGNSEGPNAESFKDDKIKDDNDLLQPPDVSESVETDDGGLPDLVPEQMVRLTDMEQMMEQIVPLSHMASNGHCIAEGSGSARGSMASVAATDLAHSQRNSIQSDMLNSHSTGTSSRDSGQTGSMRSMDSRPVSDTSEVLNFKADLFVASELQGEGVNSASLPMGRVSSSRPGKNNRLSLDYPGMAVKKIRSTNSHRGSQESAMSHRHSGIFDPGKPAPYLTELGSFGDHLRCLTLSVGAVLEQLQQPRHSGTTGGGSRGILRFGNHPGPSVFGKNNSSNLPSSSKNNRQVMSQTKSVAPAPKSKAAAKPKAAGDEAKNTRVSILKTPQGQGSETLAALKPMPPKPKMRPRSNSLMPVNSLM